MPKRVTCFEGGDHAVHVLVELCLAQNDWLQHLLAVAKQTLAPEVLTYLTTNQRPHYNQHQHYMHHRGTLQLRSLKACVSADSSRMHTCVHTCMVVCGLQWYCAAMHTWSLYRQQLATLIRMREGMSLQVFADTLVPARLVALSSIVRNASKWVPVPLPTPTMLRVPQTHATHIVRTLT